MMTREEWEIKCRSLEKENAELKAQIEKMKSNVNDIMSDCNSDDVHHWLQDLLDRWELLEWQMKN